MQYLSLSIKNVQEDCRKIAKEIENSDFKPECIVYIKSGGYLVGKYLAENLNVECSGFRLTRKGNNKKEKLSFIIKLIPKKIKKLLRKIEIESNIHARNSERIPSEYENLRIIGKNLLLVDDSVDTGNSIISGVKFLKENYGDYLNIKVAALNKFSMSEDVIKTDYYLYKDSIITYPWSKDSEEYSEFKNLYNQI